MRVRSLKWSGRWESNPRLKLGKLGYYHYTTPALAIGFKELTPKLRTCNLSYPTGPLVWQSRRQCAVQMDPLQNTGIVVEPPPVSGPLYIGDKASETEYNKPFCADPQ
jgi:hypothetical protein